MRAREFILFGVFGFSILAYAWVRSLEADGAYAEELSQERRLHAELQERIQELASRPVPNKLDQSTFLQAADFSDALSQIQLIVSTAASESMLELKSINAEPEETVGNYQVLGLKIETEASLSEISNFIGEIEGSIPQAQIPDLQVRRLATTDERNLSTIMTIAYLVNVEGPR